MADPSPGWAQQLWSDLGVPAVLAGGSALLVWARRWQRKRRLTRELREIELDATRKALDGVRAALWLASGRALNFEDVTEFRERLTVTRHEIDEVRERLWVATGHESKRTETDDTTRILKAIKRTADKMRPVDDDRPQDMFRAGDEQ